MVTLTRIYRILQWHSCIVPLLWWIERCLFLYCIDSFFFCFVSFIRCLIIEECNYIITQHKNWEFCLIEECRLLMDELEWNGERRGRITTAHTTTRRQYRRRQETHITCQRDTKPHWRGFHYFLTSLPSLTYIPHTQISFWRMLYLSAIELIWMIDSTICVWC
jgi:hypothetical protein